MSPSEAVNEIANIKGLCGLCYSLKEEVMSEQNHTVAIRMVIDYEGFQCGAIQAMKMIAWEVVDDK